MPAKRFFGGLLGALLAALLSPGVATASCGEIPSVAGSLTDTKVVFVGTVTSLENSRRWATVEVNEVWKGTGVPAEVEVRAGPKDPPGPSGVATSVDRYYKLGRQYLFFPFRGSGEIYRDNACTATTRFKPDLESFRPAGVEDPTPQPSASPNAPPVEQTAEETESPAWWVPLIPVAVVALVVAAVVALGLWRSRTSLRGPGG